MSPLTTTRPITLRSILIYACIAVGIALFIGYVIFQARFIIEGPQILLTSASPVAQSNRVVTLSGKARNIVRISLNGRQIYTDLYGNFKEDLVLENGYTIATLEAQDRYGRITTLTREFVHTPSQTNQLSISK